MNATIKYLVEDVTTGNFEDVLASSVEFASSHVVFKDTNGYVTYAILSTRVATILAMDESV